jgi:hypothetical protein
MPPSIAIRVPHTTPSGDAYLRAPVSKIHRSPVEELRPSTLPPPPPDLR